MIIIGADDQNSNQEEINIEPDEYVRFFGEIELDVIPPLLLISAGITDSNRIEYYLSDTTGEFMVKFLPYHTLEEIGWKNRRKADPGLEEPAPYRTTYTNHGLMISISKLPTEEMKDLFFKEIAQKGKVNIFPDTVKDDGW